MRNIPSLLVNESHDDIGDPTSLAPELSHGYQSGLLHEQVPEGVSISGLIKVIQFDGILILNKPKSDVRPKKTVILSQCCSSLATFLDFRGEMTHHLTRASLKFPDFMKYHHDINLPDK
jgi:hypothetical protein